jgi:TetR/AcrR family transcriptional regulator
VFFSKGWQGATMDDVADAAELSKATLYLYFKSRDELYAAILLRGNEILHRAFEEAVASKTTGLEQTEAIGRAYMRFHDEHRDYYDAMLYFDAKGFDTCDDCEYEQKCDEFRDRIMGLVAQAVANGVADGTLRPDLDPLETAVLLWAQSSGVLSALSASGEKIQSVHRIDLGNLVNTFFEFTFHAIAANPREALERWKAGRDANQS